MLAPLVEIDLRDQSISVENYLKFFRTGGRFDGRDPHFPHLRVLKVTVHGGEATSCFTPDSLHNSRPDLAELWIHVVNVRGLNLYTYIYATLRWVRSLHWRQTRCKFFKPTARFMERPHTEHLDISVHSQLMEYVIRRKERTEQLFPNLETLCLRVHYAFLHRVNMQRIVNTFPGVKIRVNLTDEEYFQLNPAHHLSALIQYTPLGEGPSINFGGNNLWVVSFTLGQQPECKWSAKTTPEGEPLACETLVARCDMKTHFDTDWAHTSAHFTDLFKGEVIPMFKTYSTVFLRRVVLPAEIAYAGGLDQSEPISLPSVLELVIQSDVCMVGLADGEREKMSKNFVQLLTAFPSINTLVIEENFLLNWTAVGKLPCQSVATLVISSGAAKGGDHTATLRAILNSTGRLCRLRCLIVKLSGSVNYHELWLTSFRTSVQHLLIWAEDFVNLTSEEVCSAFTQAVRLQCLFLFNRRAGKTLVHDSYLDAPLEENCKPTKFFRQAMARWPQYYGTFWRHLFAIASDYVITAQARKNPLYRDTTTTTTAGK